MRGFEVDGVRMVIRFTARTSLLFFCLAFSRRRAGAAVAQRLDPVAAPQPPLSRRDLCGLARHPCDRDRLFCGDGSGCLCGRDLGASYIFGGIGYAFIIAMAATSFDRTAQAIGPRAWRMLHLIGGYYLLFQFTVSFGKRIPDMPLYALFLIPLVAVFALRMISMARGARAPVQAG